MCFFVPFGCHMDAKEVQKRSQALLLDSKSDGKHAFSMIGVHLIEATILWRGGFGARGGAGNLGGLAR